MEPFLYLNSKKGNSVEAAQNPYLLHLVPKADESHKKVLIG